MMPMFMTTTTISTIGKLGTGHLTDTTDPAPVARAAGPPALTQENTTAMRMTTLTTTTFSGGGPFFWAVVALGRCCSGPSLHHDGPVSLCSAFAQSFAIHAILPEGGMQGELHVGQLLEKARAQRVQFALERSTFSLQLLDSGACLL